MNSGYSTVEVSHLIGLKPTQVRHFVRQKLLSPARGPGNQYNFSFRDVVLLRTAKSLLDASVTSRKTLRALRKMQNQLSDVRSLASLSVFVDGNNIVLREGPRVWNIETGQGHFDFSQDKQAAVKVIGQQRFIHSNELDDLDSDDWYNLGLDLEEIGGEKAVDAYYRAIDLDTTNADAHVNLGRLFQLRGNLKDAKRHYHQAIKAQPEHQLAHYNLGTIFDELDEVDTAQDYYHQAPGVPDAHFNLARIFEICGDELSALRHMRQFKSLTEG